MFKQTSDEDISLFMSLAHRPSPQTRAQVPTYVLSPPSSSAS